MPVLTLDDRKTLIDSFAVAPEQLATAVKGLPKECWQYKPTPQAWSIHQIVIHIPDSEASGFVKFRKILSEPGCTLSLYDQDAFANSLDYHAQSMDDALELFRLMRRVTTAILRSLEEKFWQNKVIHPETGDYMLDDWLRLYEEHIPNHIKQMKRNYEAWEGR